MTDWRNLDVVKAELNQLDSLCQFNDKKSNIFEHRKEVTDWILECETRISDHLERLLDKRSAKSRSSRS